MSHPPDTRLLEVRNLSTYFETERGVLHAVDDVSFELNRGEILGLVGESGCGKTVTILSLVRLVPAPGEIISGEILFNNLDLRAFSAEEMRRLRGEKIGLIFQDPMNSLNPILSIGTQISETVRTHLGLSRRAAIDRTLELLDMVGMPQARERIDDYPHQFSGGMIQRVMIAIALSCEPLLLLADEPTTALDVTIQAQILELMNALCRESNTAVILVTHDFGVVAGICDRVNVMYAGRIVESGDTNQVFYNPQMPYTYGLLESLTPASREGTRLLPTIEGQPPDLIDPSPECRFRPRCRYARRICESGEPLIIPRNNTGHLARCWGTEETGWLK